MEISENHQTVTLLPSPASIAARYQYKIKWYPKVQTFNIFFPFSSLGQLFWEWALFKVSCVYLWNSSTVTVSVSVNLLYETKVMLFCSNQRLIRSDKPVLSLSGTTFESAKSVKYLGLSFYCEMSWHDHINSIASKVSKRLDLLRRIGRYVGVDTCKHLHGTIV